MTQPLSDTALDQLFRTARSYNGWLDKPVSEAQIHAIQDLVKMGPTSANQQPGRFVWCKSQQSRERLAACAAEGNKAKILSAPVCVIIGYDLDFHEQLPWLFPHTDAKAWFVGNEDFRRESAFRNSVLQGAYLMLAARALGLDCGPMSGFDHALVDGLFFAGTSVRSNFLVNLGYGDPSTLHPRSPRLQFDEACQIL